MKEEHIFLIRMSSIQQKLYSEFMTTLRASGIGSWASSNNPIKAFSVCCKVGTVIIIITYYYYYCHQCHLYGTLLPCLKLCDVFSVGIFQCQLCYFCYKLSWTTAIQLQSWHEWCAAVLTYWTKLHCLQVSRKFLPLADSVTVPYLVRAWSPQLFSVCHLTGAWWVTEARRVNNLSAIITWQQTGQALNSQPFNHTIQCLNRSLALAESM